MTQRRDELRLETPATYRIRVQGYLEERYSDRVGGMTIIPPDVMDEPPVTTLNGRLVDQAALAGVLDYLYSLHLPILSVECIEVG
jgi:hypothetical protein